ncbi:hypothetical protein KP79_PYT00678 [Mizuhopecten yessoensis]|uniref:Uncharacterized protein n=1 Tax=Mizuhopecten yessoensis TaxID=6573 RepID=A0A210QSL9_MIZYE|nr:hypothetical protein KP79_PYT00678 [Mizuhopecten yessoensis]
MASSVGRLCLSVSRTVVPRRTFTSGKALRCHPPGIPNDSMPFVSRGLNKSAFSLGYVLFFTTAFLWPVLAARDQSLRIGAAIEDPSES